MAERVQQTEAHAALVAPPKAATPAAAGPGPPAGLKHCWMLTPEGPVPRHLVGWRRDEALGWLGRVIRPVRDEHGWLIVEDWMPAIELRPAPAHPPEI